MFTTIRILINGRERWRYDVPEFQHAFALAQISLCLPFLRMAGRVAVVTDHDNVTELLMTA